MEDQIQGKPTPPEVAGKLDELLDLAYKTRVSDIHKAIAIAEDAKVKSEDANYIKGIGYANSHLSLFYMITGQFEKALDLANTTLEYFRKHNDRSGEAAVLYTIGSVHYKTDDFHTGLQYLIQCRNVCEELQDWPGLSRALKASGSIYDMFGEYESAQECYEECMKICEKTGDKMTKSNAANPLSGIYLRNGNIKKANEFADLSIALKKETGDKRGLAFALHAKGKVLMAEEKYKEAEPFFLEAIAIHEEQKEGMGLGMALVKLGKTCMAQGDMERAQNYLAWAIELAEKSNNNMILMRANHNLYLVYKETADYGMALHALEQYNHFKEIVSKTEVNTKIKNLKLSAKVEMLEQESRIQKEKNEEIEAKNAELDTLIYRISHDIRGPISSLMGLHQVVEFEVKDEKSIEYFDLYHGLIARLNNIVMDLLNLSRVRNYKLQGTRINMKEAVRENLKSLEFLPNFSRFKINIDVEEDLKFVSDISFMNSILQNLIENAIKYGYIHDEPTVDIYIGYQDETNSLLMKVRDKGIGIDEKQQASIFELFFRANTDDQVQGSGMGLFITKNAVEKLGGSIAVESKPGDGATFTVTLPNLFSGETSIIDTSLQALN